MVNINCGVCVVSKRVAAKLHEKSEDNLKRVVGFGDKVLNMCTNLLLAMKRDKET